jgi:carboxypeptidase Q
MKRALVLLAVVALTSSHVGAQVPGVDNATVNRIRGEAITASQVMETHWWLSEGLSPRATGTPGYSAAADWAMKKFNEWGFKNVHVERFPFGQGWSIDRFSAHLLTPQAAPLIGMPRWYSPSTNGTVSSDVVHVKAANEADLAKYKGQLVGKIVILQAARPVRMLEDRIVLRMNDADWKEAMALPAPRPATPPPRPTRPTSPNTPTVRAARPTLPRR